MVDPKLKFLLSFDHNVEYKSSAGAYPLHDIHKICRLCTTFPDVLAVKISLDLLKGLWSYGGFKLRGLVTPKLSAPPSGKTMRQIPTIFWRCKNVLEVHYHHAKFGGAWISPAAGATKTLFFVYLLVCLSHF